MWWQDYELYLFCVRVRVYSGLDRTNFRGMILQTACGNECRCVDKVLGKEGLLSADKRLLLFIVRTKIFALTSGNVKITSALLWVLLCTFLVSVTHFAPWDRPTRPSAWCKEERIHEMRNRCIIKNLKMSWRMRSLGSLQAGNCSSIWGGQATIYDAQSYRLWTQMCLRFVWA